MTIHVPACPTCGMQVYRVETEEQDIHIESQRAPVQIVTTPRVADPCEHTVPTGWVVREEVDNCVYRFEFHGESYAAAGRQYGASPEDYGYYHIDVTDAVYTKTGWYATDPADPLFLGERRNAMRQGERP